MCEDGRTHWLQACLPRAESIFGIHTRLRERAAQHSTKAGREEGGEKSLSGALDSAFFDSGTLYGVDHPKMVIVAVAGEGNT